MFAALMICGAAVSCQNNYDAPGLEIPETGLRANTTISELKQAFGDELAVKLPYKDEATKTPYLIHGRVVSSDANGNIYKSIVIQDETAAMAFSVNQSSMYTDYRLGQDVVVDVTGLWMGQYNNLVQIGELGEYNGEPQITFMAYAKFNEHVYKSGLPDYDVKYVRYGKQWPADQPYCTVIEIEDIPEVGDAYLDIMSQLVEINNVYFADVAGMTENTEITFSEYQSSGVDRVVKDAKGNSITLRNSGYSSFYAAPLPTGVGTVRGILSRYGSSWQLMLRSLDDVIFDHMGIKDAPYTIEQAQAFGNNGRYAFVEGYIVGSVASGVTSVSSVSDIIFTADEAEMDNNIVIAPAPDNRNLEEMMVVELPYGSKIRQYLNVLDNPDVLGHKLTVEGSFEEWLGMHGVTDVGPTFASFIIDGIEIEENAGMGSGTPSDPYTPRFVRANLEDLSGVYITGYIVGFVSGTDFEAGAVFGADTAGKDYNGNNILISLDADNPTVANSAAVMLSGTNRTTWGLVKNPGALGQKILIQGTLGQKYGTGAVISTTSIQAVE